MWITMKVLYDLYLKKALDAVRTQPKSKQPEYTVDAEGFTQINGDDAGQKFPWSDVRHVGIITTSDGPFFDDVFFIIQFANKNICLTSFQAEDMKLMSYFNILPGFRYESAIEAMGSVDDASFHCWDVSWAQPI